MDYIGYVLKKTETDYQDPEFFYKPTFDEEVLKEKEFILNYNKENYINPALVQLDNRRPGCVFEYRLLSNLYFLKIDQGEYLESTREGVEYHKIEFIALNNISKKANGEISWSSSSDNYQGVISIDSISNRAEILIQNKPQIKQIGNIEEDYLKNPNSYKKLEEYLNYLIGSNKKTNK